MTPERLNREVGCKHGDPMYAREELIAELGAASIAQRYGFAKNIKEESCAYLKDWLSKLKESPEFIKSVLTDIKKATQMVIGQIESVNQRLSESLENKENVMLPVTVIPDQVSIKYQMLDNESAHAVYDLLTEDFSNIDSISINEQENSLIIEGGDANEIGELLEMSLDGETFSKVIKVSTLYKGHPIELISDRNIKNFQTVLERLRNNSKWLKKHGLHNRNSINVSTNNATIGYFLVTVQPEKEGEKHKVGIMDYKGEIILPFIDYEKEQNPEEAIDFSGEILRKVETKETEYIDPLGRIRIDGESMLDKEHQGIIYPLAIDREAKGFLFIPNENRRNYQMWLDSPENERVETMKKATDNIGILLAMKDESYNARVITEETNSPLDEYIKIEETPKQYEQIPNTEKFSEENTNKVMERMNNIRIEERGELREKWLAADIDGSPILSEKLSEKEYRDVKEGNKTEKELAFEHFGHYLEKDYEEVHVAMGVTW